GTDVAVRPCPATRQICTGELVHVDGTVRRILIAVQLTQVVDVDEEIPKRGIKGGSTPVSPSDLAGKDHSRTVIRRRSERALSGIDVIFRNELAARDLELRCNSGDVRHRETLPRKR